MQPFQELEYRFTEWCNLSSKGDRMVACSSGTAALHLALECINLGLGESVVVPDYAMISCARAVSLAGMEPIFVGVDEKGLIDLDSLDATLQKWDHITAVMVVHTYGRVVDMEQVHSLCRKYGVSVIEDLAEAHGIRPHPKTDAACWSFYQNKVIAGEEGGAVYFKHSKHADLARSLRCVGFTEEHDYYHNPRGHNYRLANCLAEKILSSLNEYPTNILARRISEGFYDEHCPDEWRVSHRRDVPWVYDLRIPDMTKKMQNRLVKSLRASGVPARHGFHPLRLQPEYEDHLFTTGSMSSDRLAREVIYLPLTPGLVTKVYAESAMNLLHVESGKGG